MHKVLIVSDSPNWCFARRADALKVYAPDDFEVSVVHYGTMGVMSIPYHRYDLVFLIAPNKAKDMRETFYRLGCKVPLVVSFNSGPGRAGYFLDEVLVAADWVVINNYPMWAQGMRGVCKYNACNISNGVDLQTFRYDNPMSNRLPMVLWSASKSKAEDLHDVKGYQTILKQLEAVLPSKGMRADYRIASGRDAMSVEEMNVYWNTGSVMVCASSSEGTPNIALEAAACGCAIVTTPVGNMSELISHDINGIIVNDRQTVTFMDAVEYAMQNRERLSAAMRESIKTWDWSVRSRWFYALWRKLIERGAAGIEPFSYLDKSPDEI